jgi:hypothetical protein
VRAEALPADPGRRISAMRSHPPARQPSGEEERIKRRARSVMLVIVIILAAAGLTGLVLLGVAVRALLQFGQAYPESDAALISRFDEHPSEFRELLALAWTADGRRRGGAGVVQGEKKPRLTASERRRYRELRHRLGVESVLVYNGEAEFATASWGIVPSGWSQGYVWMRKTPSPLVVDTTDNDSTSENVYRRLGGHWYLFYETW